jgi:hypothetical protein
MQDSACPLAAAKEEGPVPMSADSSASGEEPEADVAPDEEDDMDYVTAAEEQHIIDKEDAELQPLVHGGGDCSQVNNVSESSRSCKRREPDRKRLHGYA